MKDHYDGINERVIQQAGQKLQEQLDSISGMFTVPIGKSVMTPRQVKETYGLSVTAIKDLEREHGAQAVEQMLKLLKGVGHA